MVFKPFIPPLIRKPEKLTETIDANDHPAKKPRLVKDEATSDPQSRSTPTLGRKPLLQVNNVGKDSTTKTTNGALNKEEASFERFFNALWYVLSNFPLDCQMHWATYLTRSLLSLGENQQQKRTKHGMVMVYWQLEADSSTCAMWEAKIWDAWHTSQNLSPAKCSTLLGKRWR
jgi:hypothetical protein